ncbi:MAG: hypothetical protein mread185_000125 [Mycoplasmataceae bacterium]|nr:MAG: hypothetical protein mread185_000125 [Mycoplasmataceae bacterium]
MIPKSPEYLDNNFEGFLIPKFLQDLIEKYWNANPDERPKAEQVNQEVREMDKVKFQEQLKEPSRLTR